MQRRSAKLAAFVVGLTSLIGFALALATSASQRHALEEAVEWAWPVVILGTVAGALIVRLLYLDVWLRFAGLGSEDVRGHDQALLDRVLGLLNREHLRQVDSQDFVTAWPRSLSAPIRELLATVDGPESRFLTRRLERARVHLWEKTEAFRSAEAGNGFPSQNARDQWRDVGWSSATLAGASPEQVQLARSRSAEIGEAARDFEDAHSKFVETAQRLGFNLGALQELPIRE